MKFGIDVSFLSRDLRGMGRTTRALITHMLSSLHEFYFLMPFHSSDKEAISKMFSYKNIEFINIGDSKTKQLDAVWYPWGRIDFEPPCRRILSLYDMAVWRFPSRNHCDGYKDRKRILNACNNADTVITCTEFAKNEILSYADIPENKVKVVYQGVDSIFQPASGEGEDALLESVSDGCPYIFWVGSVEKRKNIEVLLAGFDLAKEQYSLPHKLIISGKSPFDKKSKSPFWEKLAGKIGIKSSDRLCSFYNRLKHKDDIRFLGFVPDAELVRLYASAWAFVFPSLYEGYGIPVIEAFASGIPVILSDIPVFNEIAQDAALFFNVRESTELAQQLNFLFSNPQIIPHLRKKGFERAAFFDWQKSADNHIKIFEGQSL